MKVYDIVTKTPNPVFVELGDLGNRERVRDRKSPWWKWNVGRIRTERLACFEAPVMVLNITEPKEEKKRGRKRV